VIQLLHKPFKNCDSLTMYGEITMQCNKGDDYWYGINYSVNTNNPDSILKLAKISKFIYNHKKGGDNIQPNELFKLIGAVKFGVYNSEYIELTKDGQSLFYVITPFGSIHKKVVAPNEQIAKRKLKGCPEGSTLLFKGVIKLH